jgi:hypothetical protein
MPQLVDSSRRDAARSKFFSPDILSRLGETLNVQISPPAPRSKNVAPESHPTPPQRLNVEPRCHTPDHDPERWDGLS